MKKKFTSLMGLVLAVGIVGSGYASSNADMYSDIPPGTWPYDSVKQLSQAGVVNGYTNGAYRGSTIITRSEMRDIVNNVSTKTEKLDDKQKEALNRLKNEFGSDIVNTSAVVPVVGTTPSTAIVSATNNPNYEKRISNLENAFKGAKLGAQFLFMFTTDHPADKFSSYRVKGSDNWMTRYRVWLNLPINDKTSVFVRFGTPRFTAGLSAQNAGFDSLELKLIDQLGFNRISVGRIGNWGCGYGFLEGKSGGSDGIYLEKKINNALTWRGTALYDTNTDYPSTKDNNTHVFTATSVYYDRVNKKNQHFGGQIGYYWSTEPGKAGNTLNIDKGSFDSSKGYLLGIHKDFGKLMLLGEYIGTTLRSSIGMPSDSPKAWAVQLNTGTKNPRFYPISDVVDYRKPHTSGWVLQYMHIDSGAIPYGEQPYTTWHKSYVWPGNINVYSKGDNMNLFTVAYQNVLQRNVVGTLEYTKIDLASTANVTSLDSKHLDDCYKVMFGIYF